MERILRMVSVLALAALVACGGDESSERDPVTGPPTVESVAMSTPAVTLVVGSARALGATAQDARGDEVPGVALEWTSLDPLVAAVTQDGVVTAVGVGATRVTASAGGKTGETTVSVTLVEPPPATVETIAMSTPALALAVGMTRTLGATPQDALGDEVPGVTLVWASLDPLVATVTQDGVVTAVGAGATRVTASAGGKQGETAVTVATLEPPPPAVVRVELDLVEVSLEEGTSRQLTATPFDAAGRPLSGLGVTWTSSETGVARVDGGGKVTAIRPGEASVTATVHGKSASARVSVTADHPADLVYEAFSPELGKHVVYRSDLREPGFDATVLFEAGAGAGQPSPSPDGTRLAMTVGTPGSAFGELRILGLDGTRLATFRFDGYVDEPAWSPDGTWIAFRRYTAGTGHDVWVVGADGTGVANLTGHLGASGEGAPTWSPSELGRIAFTRTEGGVSSIWTMRFDGGDARQVTQGPGDRQPAWSPDGGLIAFQRSATAIFGDIWVVPSEGGLARSLGALPLVQDWPAWSPDGQLIAFTSGSGWEVDVYTVRVDGSGLARRTSSAVAEARLGWLVR